ncbi:MAG: hypothetical protein HQL73_05425 [Magnetococcales bacterium]|nr:hypothetical protein [Magnetococcales bacterium]
MTIASDRPSDPPAWIRLALLLLLPMAAIVIWTDGQQYDPGLLNFSKDQSSIDTTWIPERIDTMSRLGPLRHYNRDNLSDYVDGHAESYLAQGFKHLMVADYGSDRGPNQPQLTIDIYDMGQPLYAFGILMNETPANAKAVTIGAMGFAIDQGIQFIDGPYFIKLSVFAAGLPVSDWAQKVAQPLSKRSGASALVFGFPPLGEEVATRFVKEDYHGLAFFRNVLERQFKLKDTTFQAFLITGSTAELEQVKKKLLSFLAEEKIPSDTITDNAISRLVIHDPYEGDWFLVEHGSRILGVFGIEYAAIAAPFQEFFRP